MISSSKVEQAHKNYWWIFMIEKIITLNFSFEVLFQKALLRHIP